MNEKSVKSYELVLENCETIILSNTDLIEAKFVEITKEINILQTENQTLKDEVLRANEALLIFEVEKLKIKQTSFSEGEYNAYERLTSHSDIVALEINYEDDSNDFIYLPFKGDYENEIQDSFHEKILDKDCLKIYFGKYGKVNSTII